MRHRSTAFVLTAVLAIAIAAAAGSPASGAPEAEAGEEEPVTDGGPAVLFDPRRGDPPWPSLDDRVMGGVSRSRMTVEEDVAVFSGVVSLENNGGFASVRSAPADYDLAEHAGVVLRVRGDGKTYRFRLRTRAGFDGVSYEARFSTRAGEWLDVRLPFREFAPVFRGRRMPEAPRLDPAAVRTLGLLIAGKQVGPFRLEIEHITTYRKDG